MTTERALQNIHPSYPNNIGGFIGRQPLPGPQIERVGAFLIVGHIGPQTHPPGNPGLPFGPHPHRGFETVSFILQGAVAHADSAGHESVIRSGGVQWMTAGSGIVHAELSPEDFRRSGGPLEMIQLWVNLPARLKMARPRYVGVQADAIPAIPTEDGRATVHLISGDWQGRSGAVKSFTGVFLARVTLQAGAELHFDGLDSRDVLLYTVRGEAKVSGQALPEFHLAELEPGGSVVLTTDAPAELLFGHAEPIDEPVVSRGPFVMNTIEEIQHAYAEYRAGRFGIAEIVEG
jgi:redox-sensitive bicupin YhaK (pirin superfamily)